MIRILVLLTIITFSVCSPTIAETPDSKAPSHAAFDEILKKYVDDSGLVNYTGLKKDRSALRRYLSSLEQNAPNGQWSEDEKLAYWINAYNAYTLDLIVQHYPVESIKDIGSKIQIPFVNTAWDIKFIEIGGEKYDLNNIEHGIIRKEFEEPRIHFALVCAAVSCPKLRNEAYTAEKLDEQLTTAARNFLSDPSKNKISSKGQAQLSKIFSWYGGDFKKKSTLVEYLNKYSAVQLAADADISYMEYDWALNVQK